jgi:dihydrophenazinedicarboxylate synthase
VTINALDALVNEDLPGDPLPLLRCWLETARTSEVTDPDSGVLATVDSDGRPSARVLHLHGCDDRGLLFFINTSTRKGRDLEANPRASFTFYWAPLLRQVNITGICHPTPAAESDQLWRDSAITSQAASLASRQGEPMSDELGLHRRARGIVDEGTLQPRPARNQGLLLTPETVEFWLGRRDRLHRRVHYGFAGGAWTHWSLQP